MQYSINANMTSRQYLYIDFVALIPLSVFQAETGAYEKLTNNLPTLRLFDLPVILSVCTAVVINLGFQLYWFHTIKNQDFYTPPVMTGDTWVNEKVVSYQDTVLFLATNFQYLFVCLAFSTSKPFRKAIYKNKLFIISVVFKTLFDGTILFINSDSKVWTFFDLQPLPSITQTPLASNYRFRFIIEVLINSILTMVAERCIVRVIG